MPSILLENEAQRNSESNGTASITSAEDGQHLNGTSKRRLVSTFKSCKETKPVGNTPLADFLDQLKTDNFKIGSLRETLATEGKEAYNEGKRKLPAFTPAGTFTTRNKANLIQHNGIVHHDIDGLTEGDSTKLKKKLVADKHIAYVFYSPSYGLKLAFIVKPVKNDAAYKVAWAQTAEYLKTNYGIEVDQSGKDISRLCYVSFDPDLYQNPSAKLFDVKPVEPTPPKPKSDSTTPPELKNECAQNVINRVCKMLDESEDGNRHETRLKAGTLLGGAVGAGWIDFNKALEAVEEAIDKNTDNLLNASDTFIASMKFGENAPLPHEDWVDKTSESFRLEDELRRRQAEFEQETQQETSQADEASDSEASEDERKRRGYKIRDLMDFKPEPWIVYGHIGVGSFSCIYGEAGSGKTFYALDMALSVATGKPFLGKYKVKQGPVVYICSEGGKGNIFKRIMAWMQHRNIETPPDNFIVIPSAFNLTDGNEVLEIFDIVKKDLAMIPSLVVVDTLARNFVGRASDGEDMSKYITNVDCLRNTWKAATISVHHTPISDRTRPRNASELPGACDAMIGLKKGKNNTAHVWNEKQKDADDFKPYDIVLKQIELPKVGHDEEGRPYTSCVCVRQDAGSAKPVDVLLAKLDEGKAYLKKELAETVGLAERNVDFTTWLETMQKEGRLEKVGQGKKGDPASWMRSQSA